jgi:hypothetical protein
VKVYSPEGPSLCKSTGNEEIKTPKRRGEQLVAILLEYGQAMHSVYKMEIAE